MATNQLAVVERELTARQPLFLDVLPKSLSPARLFRTVMVSLERNPKLAQCSQQSIVNAAMTAAVLGLEVDGVTGQGFLVPYAGVATFQIGYRGFNTIAARSGITINGGVVREGDHFDYKLGTGAFLDHRPVLEGARGRRIVASWATAEANGRPAIIAVLSIDEILEIKGKSQGARKADSPWNDINGPGFPAMCEKSAKRRLARSLPLSVMQQAAALDGQHEIGRAAFLAPGGDMQVVGEGSTVEDPFPERSGQPGDLLGPANPPPSNGDDVKTEARRIVLSLNDAEDELALDMMLHEEGATLGKIKEASQVAYEHVMSQVGKRRTHLLAQQNAA